MPQDDGVSPLQESMKQDYEHISRHANHNLYFLSTTCQNTLVFAFNLSYDLLNSRTNSNIVLPGRKTQ